MRHEMDPFSKLEMQPLDWPALLKNEESIRQRLEKQYAAWYEETILNQIAKVVSENPNATECYFVEYQKGYSKIIAFLACDNGMWRLPDGVTAPVEVQRIDLTAYKKLVEEGVIKTNI